MTEGGSFEPGMEPDLSQLETLLNEAVAIRDKLYYSGSAEAIALADTLTPILEEVVELVVELEEEHERTD